MSARVVMTSAIIPAKILRQERGTSRRPKREILASGRRVFDQVVGGFGTSGPGSPPGRGYGSIGRGAGYSGMGFPGSVRSGGGM